MKRQTDGGHAAEASSPPSKKHASPKKSSPKQQPSPARPPPPLDGVLGVALPNSRNRYFLFNGNFFGGFRVDAVMVDSGCNSLLLPLPPLADLLARYPPGHHEYNVRPGHGVSSTHLTLVISTPSPGYFEVQLCTELLGPRSVFVDQLRFHLSSGDILQVRGALSAVLPPAQVASLDQASRRRAAIPPRRYGLLGQAVLSRYACLQYGCMILFDPKFFKLDYESAAAIHTYVKTMLGHLPAGFNDLEDEDHDGDEICVYREPEEVYVG